MTQMQVVKSIKKLRKQVLNQLNILYSIVNDNSVKIDNGFDNITTMVEDSDTKNFDSAVRFIKSIEYNYSLDALDYQLADSIINNLKILKLIKR